MIDPNELRPGRMSITNLRHPEWGTFGVLGNVGEGIWEIRGDAGDRVLFESEMGEWAIVPPAREDFTAANWTAGNFNI